MRLLRAVVIATVTVGAAPAVETPGRLHIVLRAQSDAAPFWAAYLMEVRPTETADWELRWWRIAPVSASCRQIDVKADLRLVSNEVVRGVFKGLNPCSVRQKPIARVYRNYPGADLLEHPLDFVIVAECSGKSKVIDLPQLPWKKQEALEREKHVVARLRALYWDLAKAAGYGDGSPFIDLDDEEDFRLQRQGEAIVSELRSGRYDSGFPDSWSRALAGYTGPRHPASLRPSPRLVREGSSEGIELVGPDLRYPALLLQARIQGRVSIDYEVESETGAIRPVLRRTDGHPLLIRAAATSLQTWRATNFRETGAGPFTAVIEYDLDAGCEADLNEPAR